ncbi:MAG: hypothetical protein ACK58L_22520, partial [Planctomycetota bacterium]
KTLASIASIAHESAPARAAGGLNWVHQVPFLKMSVWFAVAFLGTSCGLFLSRADRVSAPNAKDIELLQHLSLLENYEKYFPVPSLEFLRRVSELKTPTDVSGEPKP